MTHERSRSMMITESNVTHVVRGIREGTLRVDAARTSVLWRPEAGAQPGMLDVTSPDALADSIAKLFFDPSVEGVKIVIIEGER